MPAAATDKFQKVAIATATTLDAPGYTIGDTSITVASTSTWPTDTGITFAVDEVDANGDRVANSYNEYVGTVASGTSITNVSHVNGTNRNFTAGATTRVYIPVSEERENRLVEGILVEHDQDGTHGAITATSITATSGTFTNLTISGSATEEGYSALGDVPDTVTNNGNRSYDLVFNTNDLTDTLSPGMRLKMTRTVTAPTQCADLEASSSQYFNKTSPAGTTFTDDFCAGAWIKLESYQDYGTISSRYNGTSGWEFRVLSTGQVSLIGHNAASGNYREVISYQSVPLGKWVHVTAQLDMSAYTATPTTCYVMIDGVDVPAYLGQGGSNPTAIIQAGNLEIGSTNGGTELFDGKLAQVFYSSAKITQANVKLLMGQGLTSALCTTHSIVSAYSLSNAITDINTTTANNLTAQNSALATNTDSPFAGGNVQEYTDGTTEFGIVVGATFSTDTTVSVRVPDGYALPTSGGISAVTYSTHANPYGWPGISNVLAYVQINTNFTTTAVNSKTDVPGLTATVTPGAGSRIRITASAAYINTSGGAPSARYFFISEDATSLIRNINTATANYHTPAWVTYIKNVTSGAHTYNASVEQNAAGTLTLGGTALEGPIYLLIEEI